KVEQIPHAIFASCRGERDAVNKLHLARLLRDCGGNFFNPMSDEVGRCGSGDIKISLPAFLPDVHSFSTHGRRECFSERPLKERGTRISLTCAGIGHDSDYVATSAGLSKPA